MFQNYLIQTAIKDASQFTVFGWRELQNRLRFSSSKNAKHYGDKHQTKFLETL